MQFINFDKREIAHFLYKQDKGGFEWNSLIDNSPIIDVNTGSKL